MTTPGFYEIDLVLSGVSMLNDALNTLRQHSLEMAVNAFSKRSVQCDLEKICQTAEMIRDAAQRLTSMSAEANKDLPRAEPVKSGSQEMI
jgi:hypothetical protein